MPTLAVTNFNIVVSVLGGWISLFGLVSYLCKENFYLSEALISLLAGVVVSPPAADLVRPLEYTGSEENLNAVTLYFSRLVLGVQLVLAGVQLPSRYLKKQWKPLSILLGPIMAAMWISTSLLVWALVPDLGLLHALVIGSCVAPTDPVLSNVIVKGKFADHNVPKDLQRIIIAESGANDGLGYPFLFFALYLIKYIGDGGVSEKGGAGLAMGLWFGETWGYTIILSIIYGAVVGWIAKELLHWAEERRFVDRESFLVFAISLALFIVGTCGMIGSDDVLACFIAGNVFTWDDWFRLETLDDSLQPTIDMLLNVSIFMWFGAVCPWSSFLDNSIIPIYRLIPLGILVLLFRRLPWVFAVHKFIPQIEEVRQAIFVGFFGPVGVSAIFYLYITLDFLKTLEVDGQPRSDVRNLAETVNIVVWFIAICSIIHLQVVHGLSIPLGKLGFYLPRTLTRGVSSSPASDDRDPGMPPFSIGSRVTTFVMAAGGPRSRSRRNSDAMPTTSQVTQATTATTSGSRLPIFKIGGSIIPLRKEEPISQIGRAPTSRPESHRMVSEADGSSRSSALAVDTEQEGGQLSPPSQVSQVSTPVLPARTIRFPDEPPARTSILPGPAERDT
ncbi:Sodium/hydrogen exchanger family-domain-containing protein [Diplogelasinospora grovesii]|uniref:Sodium/hydrogen exchanger family-domain-containing protein n=1 Tax=Diplogelasinospora grovesii TaxID=303347 RepID=A0AAN6SA61_9PEZI|nr:Sodium/hydrogen exchanger family-domain-containing protein [Diplogelasinospora grovesii]